jgi:PAS domain S-box-containing protein
MSNEKQKTILLVEDEELLAMAEKDILENFGYNVVMANSGEEAVEIVGKTPAIDLVLMDINLGAGIDGTEAAVLILRHRDIPVVFLSSHTEPEIVEKTEKITSYGYVVKASGSTVLDASIKMAFKLFEAKTREWEKEASLRESELKYRVLVENINDVLYTLDAAGKFTYVSPVIERLSGRKPDEILGRNFADFVHPDDLPVLIDKFRQTMGGARESFEFRVLNGGEIRHVRTSSQRVLREGVVTGLTGIMSDISQRKQEGELLRASEERYRQLVGNTDTGLVVIDDKGIVISANEPYLRLAGAERFEDVVGHSVTEWTAADEKENNARAVALCVGQGFIQDFETVYQHADGTRIDIIINATVEEASRGGKHIASLCRDISERRQSEKLAETLFTISQAVYSTDNLDELFAHVHRALSNIMPTANLFIALVSDNGRELTFPYSIDEKDTEDTYVIELDNPQSLTVEVFKTKRPLLLDDAELMDRYASGRNKVWGAAPKCWLGVPLMVKESVIGVLAVQDYHNGRAYNRKDVSLLESAAGQIAIAIERKRAEDEIKRQLAEKEILLREVHHRIKNNIASIGALLILHLKSVTNPEAVAVLRDAIGRVDSMGILYDKLLLTEGYMDVSVKNYLESLVDMVIALFPGSAKITLEKHIDDFRLDPKRLFPLGIIINELLTNKMKYAFSQRKTGLIKISLVHVEKHVTLAIQDNGIRLPEGFAVDTAKGFGLTLVRMLTKQLGGSFSMEKKAGTRCTVEFDI